MQLTIMFILLNFVLLQSNISLILHAVGEYELSLRFLEKALALNIRYYGAKSLKVAVSFHLVARTQSCMGDFRSALNNEKETYAIYKQQVKHIYHPLFRARYNKSYCCAF
jgi:protein TIF31